MSLDKRAWYIHLDNETFGPLLLQTVIRMIQNNRVNLMEFVWRPGLKTWHRLAELEEFQKLLPVPPSLPIPESSSVSSQAQAIQASPAPTPRSAPKLAAAPASKAPMPPSWSPPPPAPPASPERTSRIRKFERAPLRGQMILAGTQHPPIEIVNVSEGGMLLKSPSLPPIGMELHFRIEATALPTMLEMSGIVRRHVNLREFCGFGIEFTNVLPEHRQILKSYIRTQIFIT